MEIFTFVYMGGGVDRITFVPLTKLSQNAMSGEVLLPGRGTCLVRWHNPAGWLWSSSRVLGCAWCCIPR